VKLRLNKCVKCSDFPCSDGEKSAYVIPDLEIEPEKIRAIMISEAIPENSGDYFYANNKSFYMETTIQAFKDAGFTVSSIKDVLDQIIYITTAIKCTKITYSICRETIENCCFRILGKEIELFAKNQNYPAYG
jgi:hypothetical protein